MSFGKRIVQLLRRKEHVSMGLNKEKDVLFLKNVPGKKLILPSDAELYSTIIRIEINLGSKQKVAKIIANEDMINNFSSEFIVYHDSLLIAQYLGKDYGWFIS